ncbi:CG30356 [Drosophila busckii]|uniref:CG30356 n=2 Tax=Drosophila busckii TaxID=30019 RepID=A0A0M5J2W4_DROBS|nr:CG30356 [Drosophila busckii]
MSAYHASACAGRLWRRMTMEEKQPFVEAAYKIAYVYETKSKRVNWVLKQMGQLFCGEKVNLDVLCQLSAKLTNWNACVLEHRKDCDDMDIDEC